MPVVLRRSLHGTLSALFNFVLTAAAGVVVLGNQWVAPVPSTAWVVTGGLMLVWAAVILSALLRPVLLVADDNGLAVRRLLGWHRFAWADMRWADLQGARVVLFAATVADKERFAAVPRRPLAEADLDRLADTLRTRRPDLPLSNPATLKLPEAA